MATPSALGRFGYLPPEVRLCIWDYLVPLNLSRLSEESEWDGKSKRPGTRLAVMRTSRTLHDEISHYLYDDFQLRVHITSYNALEPWIWFEIRRIRAIWQVASVDEAITRGFGEFPFHNVHLTITLLVKKVSDKGQMVMLWEKLNRLIFFLSVRRPVKSITLLFFKAKDVWLRVQRHHKRTNGYEHEALALQLYRLENCPEIRIPQAENGREGLDWTNYHLVLSNVFPPASPDNGNNSVNHTEDTEFLQGVLDNIKIRMERRMTRKNPGRTAQHMLKLRETEPRDPSSWRLWYLMPHELRQHEQTEREHAKNRVEYWLTYLPYEENERPCQCGPEAHEVKVIEIIHESAPNKYPERSYDFTESEDDLLCYHTTVYLRQTESMMHYTCG